MTKQQIVEEIHRQARKHFVRRKYSMRGAFDTIEADLIEFQTIKRYNRGYRYILLVIDIFTKMIYAEPLKDKTGKSAAEAMEKILIRIGQPVRNLHTDKGRLNTSFFE